MRTSREVYDRIRWDPRYEPARFVIGYESRLPEPREVAYTAFVPDGEIPWHRVLYFREGDAIVWDRRTRVDTIFEGARARTEAAASTPLAGDGFFQPTKLFRFARGGWSEAEAAPLGPATRSPAAPDTALTLATYNVLCDAFEAARSQPATRLPAVLAELRALDADVIALQEASPTLLRALLAERWVRESYALSDGPEARTVDPQGVLLLTRLPVAQLVCHRYSRAKRVLVAEVRVAGAALRVGAVHLTSDHTPNAAHARRTQLDELLTALLPASTAAPPVALLGDFNQDDDELAQALARHGFDDAWTGLHRADPGLTYDVRRNAMAAAMSSTGRSSRLDRVYLREGAWSLRAVAAALFGTEALPRTDPALFPSDHFGLRVRALGAALAPRESAPASPPDVRDATGPASARTLDAAPTYHTALVLIPPSECCPPIQRIRAGHDRHAARWMPHITLVYGFVPEGDFDAAFAVASEAIAHIAPFELELAGIDTFAHRRNRTAWARPEATPPGALHALQRALEAAFPACTEQGSKSPAGFTPHLSLAQLADHDRGADELLRAWRAAWTPLRFTVREVAMISRRGDEPFAVRRLVPLGVRPRPGAAHPALSQASAHALAALNGRGRGHRATEDPFAPDRGADAGPALAVAVAHLGDACLAALPGHHGEGSLHVTGAVALGLADAGADVDAVALGPAGLSREEFFASARAWLVAAGGAVAVVDDVVAPVLRGAIAGVAIDLGYAELPAGLARVAPEALTAADMERFDRASQVALGAVRDAAFVRAAVRSHGAERSFGMTARALKRWARARGVYSNAFGFLSGFGWTLLAAWACARDAPADEASDPTATLERALRALAACGATYPVALGDAAATYAPRSRDALVLPSPTVPVRNVARNTTRATATVLRAEAALAADRLALARRAGSDPRDVFAPWDPRAAPGHLLALTLRAPDAHGLAHCVGWLEGHALGLVLELESGAAPAVRPDARRALSEAGDAHLARWVFALGSDATDLAAVRAVAARFEQTFVDWPARPPGASIAIEAT